MKLIFLIENPKHIGGGDYSIFKFAEYLARNGNDIAIFAKNKNSFYDNYKLPKNLKIDYRGSLKRYFKGIEFLNRQYAKIYDFFYLKKYIKKNKDIDCFVGYLRDSAIKVVKYGKKYNKKVVNFVFEVPPWMEKDLGERWINQYKGRFKRNWEKTKLAYKKSDILISNSKLSQQECSKWIDRQVEGFIYPGLEFKIADKIKEQKKDNSIIYVGRLNPLKNVDLIIKSLSKIKNPPLLKLIGDGEARKDLENLSKKLNVKVNFLGRVNDYDKFKEIKKSNLMVFPTSHEGFGMPPSEALYCKIPCICSDKEIFKEVYGNHVIYFKENNLVDLTEKIKGLINKKVSSEYLNENYKYINGRFTWEKSAKKIEFILNKGAIKK